MDNRYRFERLQQWAPLIFDAANAKCKRDWCRQNGIQIRQFYYWQTQVRNYILEHGEASLLPKSSDGEHHDLVRIDMATPAPIQALPTASDPAPEPSEQISLHPEIMLRYGDFQIFLGSNVSEKALTSVLKAVRHA